MRSKKEKEYDNKVEKNKKELLVVLEFIVTSYYHDSTNMYTIETIADKTGSTKENVEEVINLLSKKELIKMSKSESFTISFETALFIEDLVRNKKSMYINQIVGALTIMLFVGEILDLFDADWARGLTLIVYSILLVYLYLQTRKSY